MQTNTLMINEVFYSIQGESTWSGCPCVFVRLTGCHLRCHYCDTQYAFHEGKPIAIDDLIQQVKHFGCDLVEITGGEPLLQSSVHHLMTKLCDAGKTVLLETSGACDISPCDDRVIRIMDLKTPGSGYADSNLWSNLDILNPHDEVKFIICDQEDYRWASQVICEHALDHRVHAVLLSPAAEMSPTKHIAGVPGLALDELAKWVLADRLPVRVQTQLHKLIWDPMARGV